MPDKSQMLIEKNVRIGSPHGCVYPFAEMDVLDSFALPVSETNRLRSAATQWGRRHSQSFTTRTTDDQIRIWRVK